MSIVKFNSFLLPREGFDLHKWAVIACDQYTSDETYWHSVEEETGDAPSTLNLICPEVYLGSAAIRLPSIASAAAHYEETVLRSVCGGALVKRTTESGERWGLVCYIDLEAYNFDPSCKSLIRATEGTVPERIPPRLEIRKISDIELTHVLALIDDRKHTVIEPLIGTGKKLYDVQLMMGGGRLEGWQITDTEAVLDALNALQQETTERFGQPLLMLVGDGNHSLATAKALYESYKAIGDVRAKTSRYALVEVENLWQPGIKFEPIHRIYKAPDAATAKKFYTYMSSNCVSGDDASMLYGGQITSIKLPSSAPEAYNKVQELMNVFVSDNGGVIDYIHGASDLEKLCADRNNVGILMPKLKKDSFFEYIIANGLLPRKTFSMGEAWEKRYYMEVRSLKQGIDK